MRYSSVVVGNPVPFPEFTGERIYMREFDNGILPKELERWQPTVDAMLNGRRSRAYLMVDQKVVHQNALHRRPGLHVDGLWNPAIYAHGHGGGHLGDPGPRHGGRHGGKWQFVSGESQTLILATDVLACKAYEGWYEDMPSSGGDCSHIDVGSMAEVYMVPHMAHYGDALCMLHESIPVMRTTPRTVVRLNVLDD